jgi:ketosteroid isomerase-like protein
MTNQKCGLLFIFSLVIFPSLLSASAQNASNSKNHTSVLNLKVVLNYVKAFNAQDIPAMLQHTTEDIKWMSVYGEQLSLETTGKNPLKQTLQHYYQQVPSIQSELIEQKASGPFVYTVEKANWKSDGKNKSQCSPAIYQLEKGLIKHVWYFAAFPCR